MQEKLAGLGLGRRMLDLKKYRLGFDIWALILFLVIMCPNFIWFVVPAPNDILRGDSVTLIADGIAQVFQVVMIASLCVVINESGRKPVGRKIKFAIAMLCAFYLLGWILYYAGVANKIIILDLCAAPCIAFILYAGARKNLAALVSAAIFMICHLLYGVVNFIL